VANALKPVLVFRIMRFIGSSRLTAASIAVLAAASYGALVFSALPESYGLSGLFITVMLFALAWVAYRPTRWAGLLLVAAGFLAAGVTITNIVIYGVAQLCYSCGAARSLGRHSLRLRLPLRLLQRLPSCRSLERRSTGTLRFPRLRRRRQRQPILTSAQ